MPPLEQTHSSESTERMDDNTMEFDKRIDQFTSTLLDSLAESTAIALCSDLSTVHNFRFTADLELFRFRLRRWVEGIGRRTGQEPHDQSDSPTSEESLEPSHPGRWLEIPCRSEEEFDRHLVLDAGHVLISVKRSKETGQYQLAWREDNAVHTQCVPEIEYFARQQACDVLREMQKRRLNASGKPAT